MSARSPLAVVLGAMAMLGVSGLGLETPLPEQERYSPRPVLGTWRREPPPRPVPADDQGRLDAAAAKRERKRAARLARKAGAS